MQKYYITSSPVSVVYKPKQEGTYTLVIFKTGHTNRNELE